jgi:hypothetical protein
MAATNGDAGSEAGRALIRRRWGNQVVVRSAQVVIERRDELPGDLREQVHEATGPEDKADD